MATAEAQATAADPGGVFAEFCAAGLWPGLGRGLAARLADAGITGPEQVTITRLQQLEGIGPTRAQRLAASFEDALPAYDAAEVLASCRVPVRFAGAAVGYLGKSAGVRLREDPWLLLTLPQIRPDQADWFARQLLRGQAHPADPRRGRALVAYLLTRAARDGHTAVPTEVIMRALRRFRIEDPAAAVAAAVDHGNVLPFDDDPPLAGDADSPVETSTSTPTEQDSPGPPGHDGAGQGTAAGRDGPARQDPGAGDADADATGLLALARYALAEEAIAEGLARLAATAEPLDARRRSRGGPGNDPLDDTDEPPEDPGDPWADLDDPPGEPPDPPGGPWDDPEPDTAGAGAAGAGATGPGAAESDAAESGEYEAAVAEPDEAEAAAGGYDVAAARAGDTVPRAADTAAARAGNTAARAGDVAELDEAQRSAVAGVASHGVCVLAGGPGTGKSRTVAAVVAMAAELGLRIALAAPTGRAAKRLEELAGAPATTLHRLLGAQGRGRSGSADGGTGDQAWVFARGEEWPVDADIVVVDEASMLDAELAAALLEACADGTRLMFVGDPAQLPSIGPGRVLADIIDSGAVPVTELTTMYRQREGGVIARLATAVRGGDLPPVPGSGPGPAGHEAVVVPVRGSAQAALRVTQLVTDSIPRALGIPSADVQVVTPVHKGAAGTVELNRALKAKLNPGPGAHSGFDPGDRVVAVANHADEGFANGEVGSVLAVADDGLIVTFTSGPVVVPFKLLSDLRHGWALTVHRAQGSEWPAVVAVFPAEATGMLSRPLVYTALTRAQQHLSIVHGAGPALARAVRTIGERPRQTRLAGLLR